MNSSLIATSPIKYHDETSSHILDSIADGLINHLNPKNLEVRVIITIPAHNEEETISSCLKALADQQAMANTRVDYSSFEVLVICHNCTDGTIIRCREIQMNYPYLNLYILEIDHPEVNNVGAVRRVAMRIASQRLEHEHGYIVTTDADTIVHRYFISNILGYVGSEYGMICGKIDINMTDMDLNALRTLKFKQDYFHMRTRLEHLISPDKWDPWPRHAHNSGPNLAIRNDVYHEIGGMPPKGFLEDIALYNAVCQSGFHVRHCPYTMVTTSSRTNPRAPWGFGSELKDWSESETIFFKVEGLHRLLAKFRIFRGVRNYFNYKSHRVISKISKETTIPIERVHRYFMDHSTPGPVINCIDRELDKNEVWQSKYPLKLVNEAEKEIRDYLGNVPFDFSHI